MAASALDLALGRMRSPVLVLSTRVGRGMFSIGEALVERLEATAPAACVRHRAVEEFLPAAALQEDVRRYRTISSRWPVLLNIVYRFPPIYMRKLWRERYLAKTDLGALVEEIGDGGVGTVVCVSHRPAFWAACAKQRHHLDVDLVGLCGEFGSNLGWRYIPWSSMDGLLSPVPLAGLRVAAASQVATTEIELPARRAFGELRASPGPHDEVLVVCGLWGQGRIDRIVRQLLALRPGLGIHAVCGDNEPLQRAVRGAFGHRDDVHCYGVVESLAPLLAQCGSVVTKPGISTLLEAHAAGRKIFLLRGMPVAEDNNARFALEHFDAEWFSATRFATWLDAREGPR